MKDYNAISNDKFKKAPGNISGLYHDTAPKRRKLQSKYMSSKT
jgi:hypothetical protein